MANTLFHAAKISMQAGIINVVVMETQKMANPREGIERYFEAKGSNGGKKFWTVTLTGSVVHVRFGKLGTKGSHRDSTYPSAHVAEVEMQALIASKLNRGYAEVEPSAPTTSKPAIGYHSAFAEPLAPSLSRVAKQAVPTHAGRTPDALGAPKYTSLNLDEEVVDPLDEVLPNEFVAFLHAASDIPIGALVYIDHETGNVHSADEQRRRGKPMTAPVGVVTRVRRDTMQVTVSKKP